MAVCLILALVALAGAQDEMRATSVAVFKNGLGFVVKQGTVKTAQGTAVIEPVPAATLGTLWVAPAQAGMAIEEVLAQRGKGKERAPVSVEEFIHLNAGKKATISSGGKEWTGTILGTAEKPEGEEGDDNNVYPRTPRMVPTAVLLQTESGVVALQAGNIQAVSVGGAKTTVADQGTASLRLRLKGAGESAKLTMGYLEKGLGWSPAYVVSLKDEKTAQLTMQAVVVNDVEELKNTDLFFVVGYPNFAFAEVPSPMTLQQTLAQYIGSLNRGGSDYGSAGRLSNAMRQAAAPYSGEADSAGYVATVSDLSGAPEEDLFLYRQPSVTLAKGQRAQYNVFSATVPIAHVYTWDIGDTARTSQYEQPKPATEPQVWHTLRMTNSSDFPWTTAPAMVISGERPLAQDMLAYTPKAGRGELKITAATDIQAQAQELEQARQINAAKWAGSSYDAVTVDGTLTVKNFKSKEAKLIVKKSVTGEMLSASDEGKTEKVAEAVASANPNSRVTWEIPLKAGEERKITYRYKILVRN
jgi:hypothetical protein